MQYFPKLYDFNKIDIFEKTASYVLGVPQVIAHESTTTYKELSAIIVSFIILLQIYLHPPSIIC